LNKGHPLTKSAGVLFLFHTGGDTNGNVVLCHRLCGDIVIPVYLGGTMLDEIIINAQQRANLRSGGR